MKKYGSLSSITGLLAGLMYLLFTLLAFLRYPQHYSPLENWLSDLGNTDLNPNGAIFYNIGIVSTALLLALFFHGLSRWKLDHHKAQNIFLMIAQGLGELGAFCMLMSALFPINFFKVHALWSTSMYVLLSTAFIFLAAALRYHSRVPGWLLILGISPAPLVILTGFLPEVYVLEWFTVFLFLCCVGATSIETQSKSSFGVNI